MTTTIQATRRAAESGLAHARGILEADREEKYPGQKEFLAKLALESHIEDEIFGRSPERPLDLLFNSGVDELQSIRLGHFDPREDGRPTRLEELRDACVRMVDAVDAMLSHKCEFSEDSYCVTCGLDGCA